MSNDLPLPMLIDLAASCSKRKDFADHETWKKAYHETRNTFYAKYSSRVTLDPRAVVARIILGRQLVLFWEIRNYSVAEWFTSWFRGKEKISGRVNCIHYIIA